jgi:hypothetical protein
MAYDAGNCSRLSMESSVKTDAAPAGGLIQAGAMRIVSAYAATR